MGEANIPSDKRHLVSGSIRELNERNVAPLIEDPRDLFQGTRVPRNPLEMMDRFLISLEGRIKKADDHIRLSEHDFFLAYAHDLSEWLYLGRQMEAMGLIEFPGDYQFRITPGGYRRLQELKVTAITGDQAFVAMSFAPELDDLYSEAIEPAIFTCNYDPLRVDRREHDEKIDDFIIAEIRKSALVVADFTKQRNGVYFEAGYAMGFGIHVIRTCSKKEESKIHFDTRQYNHIFWDTPADLKQKLINRINATVPRDKATA